MVIKFYYMSPSAPSRMVWMTLKALNLDFEPQVINLMKGEHKGPEYLAINPRGRVPSLKDGDYIITESRAVAAYLCNQYEKGDDSTRLYPVDPKTRGTVDKMLYISETIDDAIRSYVNTAEVLFKGGNTREDQIDEVYKVLKMCEKFLSGSEYMAGNHLTLADFFLLAPLLTLEYPGFNDFENYPKTSSWMQKMKDLPYFEECNREGISMFKTLYRESLDKLKA